VRILNSAIALALTLGNEPRLTEERAAEIMEMKRAEEYEAFIQSKTVRVDPSGFSVDSLNPALFDWQADVTKWALRRGKAALFEACGLGKSFQEMEWGQKVSEYMSKPVMIFTPLAVAEQFVREGAKFGIQVTMCEKQSDVMPGVNVTNYEKLHHFTPNAFGGIVLDESSILKAISGATRKALNKFAANIPFRLCGTATPAPNDLVEIINHAEFLGIMSEKEMKALYFTQDGNSAHKWRLRGHARKHFRQFVSQWARAVRMPSDLGYSNDGFILPELRVHPVIIESPLLPGLLFSTEAKGLKEQRQARHDSLDEKVKMIADMVNASDEPWSVWCELNHEGEALTKAIVGAVEVKGGQSDAVKVDRINGFSEGRYRVMVSKAKCCGFGLNWQHCSNVAIIGLSNSYEQLYQLISRHHRFGQPKVVNVWTFSSEAEGSVVANIERKQRQAEEMMNAIVAEMREFNLEKTGRQSVDVKEDVAEGQDWKLYLGDSVQTVRHIESNSVGLCLFSPPFPSMYAYLNSPQDMGNSRDMKELMAHLSFLAPELLRVTMPGRNCAIHLTQGVSFVKDGGDTSWIDFRYEVCQMMQRAGWIWACEKVIDKSPQVKAVRTNDQGLQFQTLRTDRARLTGAMPDYLILFRKPGVNPIPIPSENPDDPNAEDWIEWAGPVWYRHLDPRCKTAQQQPSYPALHMKATHTRQRIDGLRILNGILETDVLNGTQARETDDERHPCPLQGAVIERAVQLWSAKDDLVYSSFAGLGSEGYWSLRHGRRFVGGELKRSYWEAAQGYMRRAIKERDATIAEDMPLFAMMEDSIELEMEIA